MMGIFSSVTKKGGWSIHEGVKELFDAIQLNQLGFTCIKTVKGNNDNIIIALKK